MRFGVHKPVWKRESEHVPNPSLERELDVDVAIVGAGITGLTCALFLKEAGVRVTVLDEAEIGAGTTGVTTAHLTAVPDIRFKTLISHFGQSAAREVLHSFSQAIDQVETIARRYDISCEFKRLDGYLYADTREQLEELKEEASLGHSLGMKGSLEKRAPLPFNNVGAARFENQGQFHILKYLSGLARQINGDHASLFEFSRVHKVEDGATCRLETDRGAVSCSKIILATHTPIGRYISLHARLAPYFSYVLGVHLKNPPPEALYWDMSTPYFYLRQVGDPTERLWIIGGCDHKTGQEVNTYERYLSLEQFIRERFELEDIAFYWGGEVFESVDGLPYVGKIPFTKNIFTATGFAGVGMTGGTLGAEILADLVLDQENEWASLYDPARLKPLASVNRFAKENANVAKRLISDRIETADTDAVNNTPAGEGRIVDKYGDRIAVYKDATNHFHTFSPVCPHLGCIVHWNKAEKTWDCPCHGSRFAPTGEVVNGPALKDLERVFLNPSQGYQRAYSVAETPLGELT